MIIIKSLNKYAVKFAIILMIYTLESINNAMPMNQFIQSEQRSQYYSR